MKEPFIVIIVVYGVMLIAMAIPLSLRKVSPNVIYGFRTTKTLSSPEIWYQANEFCGKLFIVVGALALITALALWGFRNALSTQAILLIFLISELYPLVVALAASFMYIKRLS